jgi:hypothetical protein
VKELVREEMCSAYPLDPPLAVDVGAGDSWADAKRLGSDRSGERTLPSTG